MRVHKIGIHYLSKPQQNFHSPDYLVRFLSIRARLSGVQVSAFIFILVSVGSSVGPVANSGVGRTVSCTDLPVLRFVCPRKSETKRQQSVLLAHRPGACKSKPWTCFGKVESSQ